MKMRCFVQLIKNETNKLSNQCNDKKLDENLFLLSHPSVISVASATLGLLTSGVAF